MNNAKMDLQINGQISGAKNEAALWIIHVYLDEH